MSRTLSTIGAYGTTESSFFKSLVDNGVTHFVDIRRRRGMRGSQYAYANASALQQKLKELGIEYLHFLELSPTKEIREAQKAVDAAVGTTKSTRIELGSEFMRRYESECLSQFDAKEFLVQFPQGAHIVLFCVEKQPQACHRSLLAKCIESESGVAWRDITPGVEM
jgi:uncharacterized protein (DUF488 family)